MKKNCLLFLINFLFFSLVMNAQELPFGYPESNRSKISLNIGWKFHLGDPDTTFFKADFDDSKWETVHVPHYMELTSMSLNDFQDDKYQKTFLRDVAWYRRNINVSSEVDKKVFLEFEGAHQVTTCWVNGKNVGQFAVGGYSPFHFDITDFVERGNENQITLLLDNRRSEVIPPDPGPFDYIKFAGLYRDVYLVETDPLHITFNWESLDAGIYITTPTVDPVNMNGVINVKTTVRNEQGAIRKTTVINRVIDKNGIVVLKLIQSKDINSGGEFTFNQIGSIEDDFHLWGIDDPYLYRVNTTVFDGDKLVDCLENKIGFRKVELTTDHGMLLNGKPIKLIGTNRHQHYGYIGDAMPNSLHYKDVLQIKNLGMNIIRTAHYPHDDALITACDELGVLCYEEAPTWMSIGNEEWFNNLEKAARIMIRNHRNHPSIIIWGAGINHRGYVARLHNVCKQEDPNRLTASQGSRWTGWQTSGLTDLYAQMVYGPYYWTEKEYMLAMEGGRGATAVNHYMDNPLKLGLISWTAHAYYTFHPTKDISDRARGGMMSVFRWDKSGLDWYKTELIDKPLTSIQGQWKEGIEKLTVFSNANKVELVVNGEPYQTGLPASDDDHKYLKHAPFFFNIDEFKSGELVANGIVDGVVVSSDTIRTPEKAFGVKLILDQGGRNVVADGSDILVAHVQVIDKNGTAIIDSPYEVKFSIDGDASIIGEKENIGSNPVKMKDGVASALIKAGTNAGIIKVKAKVKGLKSDEAVFETLPVNENVIQATAEPIYDFEKVRIDIGESDQLVQFEWIPWSSKDNTYGTKIFKQLGGFTAELKCENKALMRWLGEINVMGKYGFAYGEGVLCMDPKGLVLELHGLSKGKYKITTGHHAPRTNTDGMDPNQEKMTTYNIYKLPYAKEININVVEASSSMANYKATITEGKAMHEAPFASKSFVVESDGLNPVKITFTDVDGEKGVWLNTLEISQWK